MQKMQVLVEKITHVLSHLCFLFKNMFYEQAYVLRLSVMNNIWIMLMGGPPTEHHHFM